MPIVMKPEWVRRNGHRVTAPPCAFAPGRRAFGAQVLLARAFSELIGAARSHASRSGSRGARLDPEAAADHLDRLFRAALVMCGSRQLAEDLVQDTYLKVLSRPRFLRRDSDLAYLLRALRNTWYNHLRSEAPRGHQISLEEDGEPASRRRFADPELSLETAAVLDAVATLAEPFREVVAAVDLAGLEYAEAAKALGIPKGTVMSRLYRAREQIAEKLDERAPRDNDGTTHA